MQLTCAGELELMSRLRVIQHECRDQVRSSSCRRVAMEWQSGARCRRPAIERTHDQSDHVLC